jgi:hypothetical protein
MVGHADVITRAVHAETSDIRISSLITMCSSLDSAPFPSYQQKKSCKANDHSCKLDIGSILNLVDTHQTPRLPGVRSVLLMTDSVLGPGTNMLPPIFEPTASTVNRNFNACNHEHRSSSPTPSSSSCATEVHWTRGSQTEASTPSSTGRNSVSCDDKVHRT